MAAGARRSCSPALTVEGACELPHHTGQRDKASVRRSALRRRGHWSIKLLSIVCIYICTGLPFARANKDSGSILRLFKNESLHESR